MIKYVCGLCFVLTLGISSNAQHRPDPVNATSEKGTVFLRPKNITRNIIQDRTAIIWCATFDGIFRYDGKVFTRITEGVSKARFFSLLEDRNGHLWFGSIGEGVYRYDGKNFKQFTVADGLVNNEITSIYEDKAGNIWFGANGGASLYDGKSIRNFIMTGDFMTEDQTGKSFPMVRPPNEVTSIIEDKKGKIWLATRGNTFVYDGKAFTVVKHDGIRFKNVRSLLEDSAGNIWLGGNDGLWSYNGISFSNLTTRFVGNIYQDKKDNIWTSSDTGKGWALSRYEGKSVTSSLFATPLVTDIISNEGMIFGILEAKNGTVWFGTLNGVRRYDGSTIIDFVE